MVLCFVGGCLFGFFLPSLMASLVCKANIRSKFVLLLWMFVGSSVIKEKHHSKLMFWQIKKLFTMFCVLL